MALTPQLAAFFAKYGHLLKRGVSLRGISRLRGLRNPRAAYSSFKSGWRSGSNLLRNRYGSSGTQMAFPWGRAYKANDGFYGRALRSPTVRKKLRRRLAWEAGIVGTIGAAATGADYLARRQLGMLPPKEKKKKGRR